MDRLDADRSLLFGLLSLKLGFVERDDLITELNTWALRKDRPLGRLLEAQGRLTGRQLALVEESLAVILQANGDDPRAALASLSPIAGDFSAIADPSLQAGLTHVQLTAGPEEDVFATRAFAEDVERTQVPGGGGGSMFEDLSATRHDAGPSTIEPPPKTFDSATSAGFDTVAERTPAAPANMDAEATVRAGDTPEEDPFSTRATSAPRTVADSSYPTDVNATRVAATVEAADTATLPGGEFRSRFGGEPSARNRYRTIRPHAKGGLGEVFVALDEELGREVALKEIQSKHADRHESRTRFLMEAEVTGGLEHPGIVPVYGLGQYPDGRPYYAMRFIRGKTLKEAIDEFHGSVTAGLAAGPSELAHRHLLGQFIDVCNAMAYSHARGILHRDLKPANIMIGSFGETLVVDWGLAKALDRPDAPVEAGVAPLRPLSASGASETVFGSTIGTPQFMSPEQADGRLDVLGPASDIYSLGATLYYLLAGVPAFQDRTLLPLLEKVRKGEFPPPRQANPRVPAALDAVCRKAMALRPEDRYASARALADDVEHWLADEPVTVYREPLITRMARWARRHKTLVTTSAALLIATVAALAVGTVLIRREQVRTEENYQLARAAVDQMLTQLGQVELADVPQMESVREKMLKKALAFYQGFLDKRGHDRGLRQETSRASTRLGEIQEMLGDYTSAEHSYDRALALLGPLGPPSAFQADERRDRARVLHDRAVLLKKSNRFRESEAGFREALALRKQLAAEHPDSLEDREAEKSTVYNLGALLAKLPGTHDEVAAAYKDAIAEQRRLAAGSPDRPGIRSDLARSLNNQGTFLARNDPYGAERVFEEAKTIEDELTAKAPLVASYQWLLARTLSNLGGPYEFEKKYDRAVATYQEALKRIKRLADDYPTVPEYQSEMAAVLMNLGMGLILGKEKDPAQGEQDLRAAQEIVTRLLARFPNRPDLQYKLALTNRRLGMLFSFTNRKAEAEAAFRQAVKTMQSLATEYPQVPEYQSELAVALDSLGLSLDRLRRVADAASAAREAIAHQRIALEANPQNDYYRQFLLTDYEHLEAMLAYLKDHAGCASAAEELAKLLPKEREAHRRAARLLSHAAAIAQDDSKLAGDRKQQTVRSYADRAVAELRKAVEQGLKSPKELDDPVYEPLRPRDDFRALKSALESPPRPA